MEGLGSILLRMRAELSPEDRARSVLPVLQAMWPDLAGPELARLARPLRFERGRLLVEARPGLQAGALEFAQRELALRCNALLGASEVERVDVVAFAGAEAKAPESVPRRAVELEQNLGAEIRDDDVRAAFRRACGAYLARQPLKGKAER